VQQIKPIKRMVPLWTVLLCIPFTVAGLFLLLTRQDRLNAALGDAVQQEDVETVRALLDEGANAQGFVDRSRTVLDVALSGSGGRKTEGSSSARMDPKTGTRHSRRCTLLMAAAEACDTGTIRALLDRGADLNYALDDGTTALLLCVLHDSTDSLGALLEHGASVSDRDKAGQTPLHIAARSNAAGNIRMLLDHGADLGVKDAKGQTPLAAAAAYHAKQAVCALLDRGANPSELAARGYDPPLIWAAAAGSLPLIRQVWEHEISGKERKAQSETALFHAVRADNVPAVRFLLRHGVSPNPEPMDLTAPRRVFGQSVPASGTIAARTTILLAAIAAGDLRLFDLLLAHGANPNAADSRGTTPLMMLTRGATFPIVLSGISRSRAPVAQIRAEREPGWYRSIKLLLDKGADVRATDISGQTALMFGVRDAVVVDLLVRKGANVNAKDLAGRTALMLACEIHDAAVERLLAAGARINERDTNGADAMTYAQRAYRPDETERKVDLLLRYGALRRR
jgi:ankyrin repeat protein